MFKLLLLSALVLTAIAASFQFPVSITVVRHIEHPLNTTLFLKNTGCCRMDSSNNSIGYNMISLDGFRSDSTVTSFQNSASPLAMWLNAFNNIAAGKRMTSGSNNQEVQNYLLDKYRRGKAKLLFNAISNEGVVSQLKINAGTLAQNIISMLSASQLDGVSIQFSDYHSVNQGTASAWLDTLLSSIRRAAVQKIIVLIVPPTFLARIPLFQQQKINSFVDLFVLKYYDMNKAAYTSYNSLANSSSEYPGTAFLQILKSSTISIDICKTLIAKPSNRNLGRTRSSFMDPSSLSQVFGQLYREVGWFGGFANLDFQSDENSSFQSTVLQSLRLECERNSNCFCSLK